MPYTCAGGVQGRVVPVDQPGTGTQRAEHPVRQVPVRGTGVVARPGTRRWSARCPRTPAGPAPGPVPRRPRPGRTGSVPAATSSGSGSSRQWMWLSTRAVPGTLSVKPSDPVRAGQPSRAEGHQAGRRGRREAAGQLGQPAQPAGQHLGEHRRGRGGERQQVVPEPVDQQHARCAVPRPASRAGRTGRRLPGTPSTASALGSTSARRGTGQRRGRPRAGRATSWPAGEQVQLGGDVPVRRQVGGRQFEGEQRVRIPVGDRAGYQVGHHPYPVDLLDR